MYSTEDDDGTVCLSLWQLSRGQSQTAKQWDVIFLPFISWAVVLDLESYAINVKKKNTQHKIKVI